MLLAIPPVGNPFIIFLQVSLRAFFGQSGPWFETGDLDGDKNSIFHDVDGSVTNYNNTFVARMDNYLIRHPKCVNITEWNGVICSGTYAQVRGFFFYSASEKAVFLASVLIQWFKYSVIDSGHLYKLGVLTLLCCLFFLFF